MKNPASDKLLYADLSYKLQGVFFEVYNVLGPGFREETYRQAVMRELQRLGIPFKTEHYYDIDFKGGVIDRYRADLVVDDKIIVELKAVVEMPKSFVAYLLSYLRASKLRLGVTTQPASLRAFLRSNTCTCALPRAARCKCLSTYRRIPQAAGEIASSNRMSCACERSAPRKDG